MAHAYPSHPTEETGNKLDLGKIAPAGLLIGVIALAILAFRLISGDAHTREDMWGSYLYGVMVWLSVTLGLYGLSILHHTVRGSWSVAILRLMEAGGGWVNLTAMAVLMLPIVLMPGNLYEWAHPEVVKGDVILEHKAAYLNPGAFAFRFFLFFGLWIAFAWGMQNSTRRQEKNHDFKLEAGRSTWGAVGMVMFMLTTTFAFTDWLMSLTPHWYSTMWGVWLVVASAGAALALCNVIFNSNADKFPYNTVVAPALTKDLGNMQFVMTMLWGYTSISQFLIIWNGNIPETTSWFKTRSSEMHPPGMEANHWGVVGLILIIGRFFIPFFALLAPRTKRFPANLRKIAGWIFVMHVIDMYLIVQPSIHGRAQQGPLAGHLLWDILALIGVGGIWLFIFGSQARKASLLPSYDNRLQEAVHNAH